MPKRLLMYQIDHIKGRVRAMLSEKQMAINKERQKACEAIPKPEYWTPEDAARAFNDGAFNIPLKGLVGKRTRNGRWIDSPTPFSDRCVIDIMALSGYGAKNHKLQEIYDKKCDKAGKKFRARSEKAKAASEALITKLVLGGAEEYEKALADFANKTF